MTGGPRGIGSGRQRTFASAGASSTSRTRFARNCIESGLATTRAKDTALQARYLRVRRQRGHKKAVVAVGHQILEIAYYIMRDGVTYHELGAEYFDRRHRDRAIRRHVHQLEALGYRVTIEQEAA